MTKVKRPVHRETTTEGVFSAGKNRPVIISIEPPNMLGLRLKGTRRTYRLPAEAVFMQALKADQAREKREKVKAKKARKRGKKI